jgi:ADP-ribose pyrophosphatase YjhB (NUDIX family)
MLTRQTEEAMRMSSVVSVKGVLIEDGSVVLLENERGEWELPGGRPELSEDAATALAREFAEELGAVITIGPIIDCWNYEVLPGRHVTIVTYAVARAERGTMRISDEHRRFGWFALNALDTLPLPEGYRRSIHAAAADPHWLTLARELHAMAQTGLHFTQDKYDAQRYERLRGMATEMMVAGTGTTAAQVAELFQHDIGYATPRVGVRGAVFRDGKILMVREASDGRWAVPGGWCDVNQSPRQCVEREIWEESGFTARAVKLAAVWDRRLHGHPPSPISIYTMCFICELTGGAPRPSIETTEIDFFDENQLPDLSPGRNQPHQIRRMFAHHRQPDLPTDFE